MNEVIEWRGAMLEDGVFIVDADSGRVLEALPLARQRDAERSNFEVAHKSGPARHVEILHNSVRDITPHVRLLRRARQRVMALAAANHRKDEFLRRERIDLRLVVNNAIETLQPDISDRGHHLCVALPHLPVWLQGDSWRLEQVFVNLLANASKYTDAGGELAVWMHTRGDGQAVVRIRDSGIGIAPDALPRIFDLFRQTDEADDRSRSGLGIGLALVRNLVESHGGSVIAASAGLGKGSEFTVRLPRSGEVTPAVSRIPS
jgi:signal transduction histidine kinase